MVPLELQEPIKLTNEEQALFKTLVEAAEAAGERTGKRTVLRCAGGWVRDKLLGRDSHDIDVALDNMLGKEFAEEVNKYLTSKGQEARTAAVIQSNPDQSKHLETARMKVNNMWIDLVNLRSESYADGSRIPKMEFGTPEQDALRRDFTINSLFYNLNEQKVEDLTGKGKDDLRAGIMRTPLPPTETFLDDPLRVLRAVRFGTRFGFELEASILEAAASVQVRQALANKVSRERVGTELEGMFNGPAPTEACRLLHTLCLFPEVFTPPPEVMDQLGRQFGAACVECMGAAEAILNTRGTKLDKDERRALLLAALLLPLRLATHTVKSKPAPISSYIIRNSLKWRVKDIEAVAALHEAVPRLLSVHAQLRQGSNGTACTPEQLSSVPEDVRIALGRIIRTLKQHWQLGVMLAPVSTIPSARPLGVEAVAGEGGGASGSSREGSQDAGVGVSTSQQREAGAVGAQEASVQQWVAMVEELMAAVHAFGLQDCWQWKLLLDGKEAMKAVGMAKGGPQLGKLLAAVMDWQLAHPEGSVDECREYLAANHKDLATA